MPKPPPYQRPSIQITSKAQRRSWQNLPARLVDVGDTWASHGKVRRVNVQPTNVLIWAGKNRHAFVMGPHESLWVFHRSDYVSGN